MCKINLITETGQMSAGRFIEMLHLDKSYVSRLIRNFEQKGIVGRKAKILYNAESKPEL